MKSLLRAFGWVVLAGIFLASAALLYSTYKGYTKWYFRVNGRVTVSGVENSGYMHADAERTVLLITRADERSAETYLVSLKDERSISECADWHPIRFLPFPVGDLNSPCPAFAMDPKKSYDTPVASTVVRNPRSVEFSTASGKKVKAEW